MSKVTKNDVGHEWGTPQYIVEPLSESIGGFDLDPASGAEPKPYAETRYTVEEDGLSQKWFGHVWLNPPYGREHNSDWAKKTYQESQRDEVDSITALLPGSTSTDWWQNNYAEADVIAFIDHRVNFIGSGEHAASFASVICVFGVENLNDDFIQNLDEMGCVFHSTEVKERSIMDF